MRVTILPYTIILTKAVCNWSDGEYGCCDLHEICWLLLPVDEDFLSIIILIMPGDMCWC